MVRKEFRIILLSLGISLLLTIAKFAAYFVTHSVAILSDALESIINVVAGGFACYSIYLAGKPKDANHPYGHGKVEFFSIGFEGAMIFFAGCLILYQAVQYFIMPPQIEDVEQGMWMIGVTSVANLLLGLYLIRAGKKLPSITIAGNGQHILTDAYTSFGLLVALLLIQLTKQTWIDPAVSVIMGVLILRKGYQLMRQSISGLMDETDMQVVDKVIAILEKHRHATWIDVHNMRVQRYGTDYHIDCHVTMPYYLELSRAHEEVKEIEALVARELPAHNVEFFIHIDPCIPDSCENCLLAECPVRSHPFRRKVSWTRENVLPNRKHTV